MREAHQPSSRIAFTMARRAGAPNLSRRKGEEPRALMLFNGAEHEARVRHPCAAALSMQAPSRSRPSESRSSSGEETGLVVASARSPNRDPSRRAEIVMRRPGITALAFKFQTMRRLGGPWDGQDLNGIRAGSSCVGST